MGRKEKNFRTISLRHATFSLDGKLFKEGFVLLSLLFQDDGNSSADDEERQISLEDFELLAVIGRGSFAKVCISTLEFFMFVFVLLSYYMIKDNSLDR